ncbi:DoxX-like family protein [Paenibacillus xanthanilyticus]|uniref:DoxX-like family protein n=1 Tax=Paenibacillus xanthanilyticus TaxID=1783531 RepID=A0ABV8K5B9_9BACL
MKRAKPIYVELDMKTDMDHLWAHTQQPDKHEQWDLRFSEIRYLPKTSPGAQHFRYMTRIGFGLRIEGSGETKERFDVRTGERVSTLRFGSEQRASLIREGRGYWKYVPQDGRIVFLTQYDYDTRFGSAGKIFDRYVFRPLMGYATAWSFDALRIWLERGIVPAITIERALIHYGSVMLLAALWTYEGLVPKLLMPGGGELELMLQTGWFPGRETNVLTWMGIAEIGMAAAVFVFHRHKRLFAAQGLLLGMLAAAAFVANPELLAAPFNPLTLSLPMIGLGWVASRTANNLPQAGRCRRRPVRRAERKVDGHGVHL